jgi:hypothetical protein
MAQHVKRDGIGVTPSGGELDPDNERRHNLRHDNNYGVQLKKKRAAYAVPLLSGGVLRRVAAML